MPHRNRILFKLLLVPLGLLAMLFAIVRRRPDDWEYESVEDEPQRVAAAEAPMHTPVKRRAGHRVALAASFTVLFFAGASFTAGAGDQMAKLVEDEPVAAADASLVAAAEAEAAAPAPAETAAPEAPASEAPAAETQAPAPEGPEAAPVEAAPAEAAPIEAAPAEAAPAEAAPAEAAPIETAPIEAAPAEAAPADPAADAVEPAAATPSSAPAPSTTAASSAKAPAARSAKPAPAPKVKASKQWVVARAEEKPAAPEIEHEGHGHATVWLNRSLPDPTPASARLTKQFARQLVGASRRHDADWASVLAVLRAQGERGATPATARQLDTLARRLAGTNTWKGALALSGRTGFADRAAALADLYRFVGIQTLVTGYAKAKNRLARKVLNTEGVFIYDGGREDIARGRIDVRVLALIGYLAERHESLTVSSLFSGHRMFSRPGVISAHMFGHAIDIAAIGGTPILGNQEPGGLTEEAVRSVLLLPSELQPRQVISLLGLGGPSFPMLDHGDHIHVGY